MDVEMIFKIAAIGILISVISQVLTRAGREDIAMLATLTGLVIALTLVVGMISEFFSGVRAMFGL